MANTVMADSISYLPEFRGWYDVIKETIAEVNLGDLLIYMIDNCDVALLPFFAEQFDVLGYKGWRLAQTEDDRRGIIKRSIELHRYKGTEWAIKESLKSIGFSDIELIKTGYDHWAKFGIKITNGTTQLTDSAVFDITQMVVEYKRAVCVLEEILITIQVEDVLYVDDSIARVDVAISASDNLVLSGTIKYDGETEFDGAYSFSGDGDVALITEV